MGDEATDADKPIETPIPFPDGVVFELNRTQAGISLYYRSEAYHRIIAFYDEWTAAELDSYERAEPSENVTAWCFVSDSSQQLRMITIQRSFDGGPDHGTVAFVQLQY